MKSFYTENGDCITFNDIHELSLCTADDVITHNVTGYYVQVIDGPTHKVTEEVYRALELL